MSLTLNSENGNIISGGGGADGDVVLKSNSGSNRIHLDGNGGNAWLGGNGADGDLVLFDNEGDNHSVNQSTIHLDGHQANIFAGGQNRDGDLVLRSKANQNRIRLDADGGNAWLGGNGADGDLVMFRNSGDNATVSQSTIHLDGQQANMFAGGQGADGDIVLRSSDNDDRIRLDAGGGNLWMGGNGADGDIVLFADSGDNQTLSQATIHLNGQAGDIVLQNADCAEQFCVEAAQDLEPGSVVVISGDTTMKQSDKAYDKCVGGIIAGAGDLRPGIVLGKNTGENQLPIALVGRVWCKADASYGAIEIGDLLTTSDTPGHAMAVKDHSKSQGAILGKALTKLESDQGMIRVLVSLQ